MALFAQPEFLGRGWSFPPSFSANGVDVAMVANEADIQQSMQIILSTAPGERVMRSSFGCDLSQFLYEDADRGLMTRMTETIRTGLSTSEPRIDVLDVTVDESDDTPGLLLIAVSYQIRVTNSRFNMVYPFYLSEGSSV